MTRAVAARRRGDSEAGATLIIALVMIMIISVAIVAVLAYASTSLHTISVIREQRGILYAADGSVQTAIQAARSDTTAGTQPAGSGCGSLATLSYAAVGGQPASSVDCTVVVARGPGEPGVDMPPYALWAVGPGGGETGIDVGKSGGLSVAGSVASNMPGTSINATDLDITGYTAEAKANCTGTITVADPADKMCNTGASYPDPNYPSQTLPSLSSPNPAPTCTANNAVLQFSPGYYTDADMLSSPTYSQGGNTCRSGYVYLRPGVYYFDFGFDPQFPGNVWDANGTVIGGEPKGWNPDVANSLPQSIANGSNGFSVNCKTELDGATSGVQLVFGGASQMTADSNSTQVELCADPTPSGTGQQIAMYGLKTGSLPVPQTATREANASVPTPAVGWTGLSPQNKVLPISPNPSAIDGQVAAYTIPSANPGGSASMQLDGFAGIAPPGGSINVSYTLNVAHREIAGNNNRISSLEVQIGSCVIPVPLQRSSSPAPPVVDELTAPCLAAAVASNFSVTFTATARKNQTFTENLDGVNLVVSYTPPVYSAQSGCVVAIGSCAMLSTGSNKAAFVMWGTLYAPLAFVSADFKNKSVFEFHRGVVARAIATDAVPPADSSQSFCLGYGSPCLGPARVLKFTATVSGATRLVALVQYFDSPYVGRTARALVESRAFMIAAECYAFFGQAGKGGRRRMTS